MGFLGRIYSSDHISRDFVCDTALWTMEFSGNCADSTPFFNEYFYLNALFIAEVRAVLFWYFHFLILPKCPDSKQNLPALTNLLLLKSGYAHIPYVSLEEII